MRVGMRATLVVALAVVVALAATRSARVEAHQAGDGDLAHWLETVAGGVIGHLTGPGGEVGFHLLLHPCETYWGTIAAAVRAEELRALEIMASDPLGRTQAGRDAAARQQLLRALAHHWLKACQGDEAARTAIRDAIQEFRRYAGLGASAGGGGGGVGATPSSPNPAPPPPMPPSGGMELPPIPTPTPMPTPAGGSGGHQPDPSAPRGQPDNPDQPNAPVPGPAQGGGGGMPFHDDEIFGFAGWAAFDASGVFAVPLVAGQVRTITMDVRMRNNTGHPDMAVVTVRIRQVPAGCGVSIGSPSVVVALPPGETIVSFEVSFLCVSTEFHLHGVGFAARVHHLGAPDNVPMNNELATSVSLLVSAP